MLRKKDIVPALKRDRSLGRAPLSNKGPRDWDDGGCHAGKDGDCFWKKCPQIRDNEPHATGRHCTRDTRDEDD